MVVDIPTKDAKGDDLSIEQCLKQAMTTTAKQDQEEAKQEESAEVAEPQSAEEEPTLPKYETHSFPKPQIGKRKSTESVEQKDPQEEELIQVALLKFDGEQAALRYLVSAARKKASLNLLSGVDIARILDPRYRAAKQQLPGVRQIANQIEGLEQLVPELVRVVQTSTLISAASREAILKYTGLSEAAGADDEEASLREILDKLGSKEAKVNEDEKRSEVKADEEVAPEIQCAYLPCSDQVMLARASELKLAARPATGAGEFLSDPASAHFGNRLRDLLDEVRLFVTPAEVRAIGQALDVGQLEEKKIAQLLLSRLDGSYDGTSIVVPYFEALLAVKAMVRAAISQFKRLEDKARALEVQDLLQKELPAEAIEEAGAESKNLIDVNMLLAVLVQLEDQLYQMASQSDVLSGHAKTVLYSREMSRAHTAYGRLSSLMALPSYS